MRTIATAAALACLLAQAAATQTAAQTADGLDDSATADEDEVGSAAGVATSAASATFFIAEPLEYHLLASTLPGQPVFLDATDTGIQRRGGAPASGEAGTAFLEGERPVGTITDLILDRRGGAAGLVMALDPDLPGGDREIAVAMGLVRMLPDSEDVAQTHIFLSVAPADIENAPTFGGADMPEDASGAGQAGAEAPAEAQPAGAGEAAEGATAVPQQETGEAPMPDGGEAGDAPQPQ